MSRGFARRPVRGVEIAIFLIFGCLHRAAADGGRLRFRREAGPFVVTLFTAPDPLTTGRADFSVAVERVGRPGLVENAHIDFILTPASGRGGQLLLHASHAEATGRWLQAANFSIPARGVWRVIVAVRQGGQAGECAGELEVGRAPVLDVMWDILPVPLLALLFMLHQKLKQDYSRKRRNTSTLSTAQ